MSYRHQFSSNRGPADICDCGLSYNDPCHRSASSNIPKPASESVRPGEVFDLTPENEFELCCLMYIRACEELRDAEIESARCKAVAKCELAKTEIYRAMIDVKKLLLVGRSQTDAHDQSDGG